MAYQSTPRYYAVRHGRTPGVYDNWDEFEEQVLEFPSAVFKRCDTYDDALAFLGFDESEAEDCDEDLPRDSPDITTARDEDAAALMPPPPPASQSYFDQFNNFVPNCKASFDDEFHRFASSQGIVSGSQEYRKERTKAIRDELKFHYSSQPNQAPAIALLAIPKLGGEDLDEQAKLDIYQNMCREIGIPPEDTIAACRQELKKRLVNIIDYIDARRTGKKVKIWDWSEFTAFSDYSLQDEKRMDIDEAKADGGFLSALLQRLIGSSGRKRGKRKRNGRGGGVSKRVRV